MLCKLSRSAALILAFVVLSLGVSSHSADAADALQTWLFNVEGMT